MSVGVQFEGLLQYEFFHKAGSLFSHTELSICPTAVTFKSQFNHLLFKVLLDLVIPLVTEDYNVVSQSSVQT